LVLYIPSLFLAPAAVAAKAGEALQSPAAEAES
jgi:hypothetical protein